jgi:hypothetical protein
MAPPIFASLDFTRWDQPRPESDLRVGLIRWLEYQRHEFQRKWRDLEPAQLAAWSVPPVELSVLGLIRHMQQMEHVCLSWGLGGGERIETYGDDDFAGGTAQTVDEDVQRYLDEVERSAAAIELLPRLDSPGLGHGKPLGDTLIKMIDEYALHSGQAHMLRFAALGQMLR